MVDDSEQSVSMAEFRSNPGVYTECSPPPRRSRAFTAVASALQFGRTIAATAIGAAFVSTDLSDDGLINLSVGDWDGNGITGDFNGDGSVNVVEATLAAGAVVAGTVALLNAGRALAVQAGGHADAFHKDSDDGLIAKETDAKERDVYEELNDPILAFVPSYHGSFTSEKHDEKVCIRMQNLTAGCARPCIMDIKMGIRTFVEAEVAKTEKRKDLAKKMADGGGKLTDDEVANGITKLQYMQFRERESSTSTFGWRIEAIVMHGSEKTDGKKLKERADLLQALRSYLNGRTDVGEALLARLLALRSVLEASSFFRTHEFIGSSLLFVCVSLLTAPMQISPTAHNLRSMLRARRYDEAAPAASQSPPGLQLGNIWMIDFAKTAKVAPEIQATYSHHVPWERGNQADGYLTGIDSLIECWQELVLGK